MHQDPVWSVCEPHVKQTSGSGVKNCELHVISRHQDLARSIMNFTLLYASGSGVECSVLKNMSSGSIRIWDTVL